jgi:Cft2 family RNA processing exonuclease
MITITFLGASRTVTGSKYLVESNGARIMVDSGLFQGLKVLRERNWQDLPVPAASIQAIVLTHAHLDHCGYLPRLVAQGFRGRIFCTQGTQDLCRIVLPDSAKLQEEDAELANRHGFSKHKPALPLYRDVDAARALTQLQPCGYERTMPVAAGIEVEFINAGHLLGSSYVRMRVAGRTILFGGDLGRFSRPVLPDPTMVAEADYLLVESTYGDRVHEPEDGGARLAQIVTETADRGGKLIVPAFAIGRVEELIYWFRRLETERRIPILPVFLDSPMAAAALARYRERLHELDPELQPERTDDKAPHDPAAHEPQSDRERHSREERDLCAFCTGAPERAQYRALRRLPGSGDARPAARRRREEREDPRRMDSGGRVDPAHRLDVGARRFDGNHAMAPRLLARAARDLHRARRAAGDGGAVEQHHAGARLDHPHARTSPNHRTTIKT